MPTKEWYEKNKESHKAKVQAWKIANPDYQKTYYAQNRDKILERAREHKRQNRAKYTAHQVARDTKTIRTKLYKTYKDPIEAVYTIAKRITDCTGIVFHVDHVIPITHKDVSGLHVPWNLRIVSQYENQQKYNSWLCPN